DQQLASPSSPSATSSAESRGATAAADSSAPIAAGASGSAGAAPSAAPSAATTVVALGDAGDLSTAAARTRLLARIDGSLAGNTAGNATTRGVGATALGCAVDAPGDVVATGTGTYGARPAAVVVTRDAEGALHVRVVTADPCTVRTLR